MEDKGDETPFPVVGLRDRSWRGVAAHRRADESQNLVDFSSRSENLLFEDCTFRVRRAAYFAGCQGLTIRRCDLHGMSDTGQLITMNGTDERTRFKGGVSDATDESVQAAGLLASQGTALVVVEGPVLEVRMSVFDHNEVSDLAKAASTAPGSDDSLWVGNRFEGPGSGVGLDIAEAIGPRSAGIGGRDSRRPTAPRYPGRSSRFRTA